MTPPALEDDRTDHELLRAHVAGDGGAFGVLVTRHRDRLWAVALRTTGDREEAADALQEALVNAHRRAAGFRGDAAVTTWLHRVVVNACLDRMRRAQVRRADPLPDDVEHRARLSPTGATPEDPAAAAVDHERRDRVLAALSTLPHEQRAALVLVDMEGFPVAEAAEILEVPIGTVKSRCSRGRARLAELLRDVWREPASEGPVGTTDASGASHPEATRGGEQP
ncbi:RNA polymerase, sigma subunit, ECF family [Nocardioides scoriae]|uniref:RNA polymerase, sigma subunit, ECF family n=1 Tax=Nocardioides scoriae TaxID=642780 RepID=A0A1H1VSM8_9ACTN|nr:RNA polymerase sigma factor SigM [Nocardioides scoriae]SDS87934.1 RNA polymerase, sigma subunit, ECF family [Nocardioides scoriae]